MGVADIGLENQSGVLVPYELNTTSVAGTVNIANLQSLYVDGDGPDTYGIQLNSVVNGVTIWGNSSFEFWSQNYIGYTVSTQQLVFGDEVWNFSSPSGYFPTTSIYGFSPNGTYGDFPYLYQGYGPSFTIGYPFTLTLYLNTSTIADRPALYFNYTVSNDTFRQSSSFDYLIFNSSVGIPTQAAPTPYYQADGYNYDPIGLINDMEIDILGNDDGDTTAFLAADATVSLQYWNASAGEMQEVPSAYNAGQETGENAVGLLVYSSGGANPIGMVRSGPGLVGGLWNYSGQVGAVADSVTIHPVAQYSFLFVNIGSAENDFAAQWVPTSTTGTTTFYLPTGGTYFLNFLMSNHDPASQVVTATGSVTLPTVHLVADPSRGVYTPLFALDNAQLAALSSSGVGSEANPYIVLGNQYGSLAPQFGAWNDYLFPVFPGLLIAGTSAWAEVTPPSFEINLPSWDFASPTAAGLPMTNDLQLQFYDASNISLVRAGAISGWLSAFLYGFPESSVMMWDCTNMLVASNTFDDQGNALLLYGGTNNTVWGNTLLSTPVVATNPASVDDYGPSVTGVNETESGDLVYNNLFEVGIPAITPTTDPFPCDQYGYCNPVTYYDAWNVTDQPATNYSLIGGWNLTGSIIGTSYQGGNYWSNYGTTSNPFGVLPYNNTGAITAGGDYVPLVPFSLYNVTFQETGLGSSMTWNVTEGGVLLASNSTSIVTESPNGTFSLSVGAPTGYTVTAAPSQFTVDGAAVLVNVTFAPLFNLEVQASGFPTGPEIGWWASINGTGTGNTTVTQFVTEEAIPVGAIFFSVPSGTYNVTAGAAGYSVTPAEITVAVPSLTVALFTFTPDPGVLDLQVTPSSASVWVDGHAATLSNGAVSMPVPAGITSIEATDAGYQPYFTNVTVGSNWTTTVTITLTVVVAGTLSLSVSPGSATVWVDGTQVTLASGAYSALLAPGVHSVEAAAVGYLPFFNNVTVTGAHTSSLTISLTSIPTAPAAPAAGVSSAAWAAIGLLAALAVVLGLIALAYRSRGRRPPPKPIAPASPPGSSLPPEGGGTKPTNEWSEE
jgi:thermopsin